MASVIGEMRTRSPAISASIGAAVQNRARGPVRITSDRPAFVPVERLPDGHFVDIPSC